MMGRHAVVVGGFAAAVAWWLWPVLTQISSVVPGAGPGDNLTFVWNVWWTRFALTHPGQSVFFSPFLLHPIGANLTLHSNTLLPAVIVSPIANPVLAQNLLIATHLFLNLSCTYALAWRETRRVVPALAGAVAFGWAPYVPAHLNGHFNLIAAWALPLSAWTALAVMEAPGLWRGAVLGLVLGASAYVDYYVFVYSLLLTGLLLLGGTFTIVSVPRKRLAWLRWMTWIVVASLLVDAAIVLWLLASGGGDYYPAGFHVSIRSVANPLAAGWLLLLLLGLAYVLTSHRLGIHAGVLRTRIATTGTAIVTLIVALLPLLLHAIALWRAGGYTTQRYFWRSAPAGVDVASLFLGNPFSLFYGTVVAPIYDSIGVNQIEQIGWIGPAVLALTAIAILRCPAARTRWGLVLCVFGVWSLGPYVEIAGHATTLWLPATLVRWIPVLSNARIPGRAIVVVSLCCAMLSAHALSWLLTRPFARAVPLGAALFALLVFDYAPYSPATYHLPAPSLYDKVRQHGVPGAVCELPLGIRDGFGETGRFDSRTLYFQTVHERPILGGFVARLPRSAVERYLGLPIVGPLLRLSGGGSIDQERPDRDRVEAAQVLASLGIRYFVIDGTSAPPDLLRYVHIALPLRLIAEDNQRALYLVDPSVF